MKTLIRVFSIATLLPLTVSAQTTPQICTQRIQTIEGLANIHDTGQKVESMRHMLIPLEMINNSPVFKNDLALHEAIDELDANPALKGGIYVIYKKEQCALEITGAVRQPLSQANAKKLLKCPTSDNPQQCAAEVASVQ